MLHTIMEELLPPLPRFYSLFRSPCSYSSSHLSPSATHPYPLCTFYNCIDIDLKSTATRLHLHHAPTASIHQHTRSLRNPGARAHKSPATSPDIVQAQRPHTSTFAHTAPGPALPSTTSDIPGPTLHVSRDGTLYRESACRVPWAYKHAEELLPSWKLITQDGAPLPIHNDKLTLHDLVLTRQSGLAQEEAFYIHEASKRPRTRDSCMLATHGCTWTLN